MLGGTAEEIMQRHDYNYPFNRTKQIFQDADIVIGNLEGPLTNTESRHPEKEYLFKSPPDLVAPALKKAGFNLMNLANNHILDYGVKGMNDTTSALHNQGIAYVGTGKNLSEARNGRIMQTPYGNVGFLSYSLTFPEAFWATDNQPGTAFGHEEQITEDITRLEQRTDSIVVSFHWGREKQQQLRPYQPKLAHAAIDAGADIVLGHHPHILQAIEHYKDGIILYSLGNYAFGSYSQDAQTSVIAKLYIHNGKFHNAELTPINVLNTEVLFQPIPLKNKAASKVIKHLNQLSAISNTQLELINHKGYLQSYSNKTGSLALNN